MSMYETQLVSRNIDSLEYLIELHTNKTSSGIENIG